MSPVSETPGSGGWFPGDSMLYYARARERQGEIEYPAPELEAAPARGTRYPLPRSR